MSKIVVMAQTPPPFHGQSIMQQYLVDQQWTWCEKEHVRLNYSDSVKEIGGFSFSKVTRLFRILQLVWRSYRKKKIDVLYYPPAGPHRVPLYRDIITLMFVKRFSSKVVLHFHAGGLSELIHRLNKVERIIARRAFKNIDTAIVLLPWLKAEVEWFSPKKVVVVPNGISDIAADLSFTERGDDVATILFVGNLNNEKGIFVLLEAVVRLKKEYDSFKVRVMGDIRSNEVGTKIKKFIEQNDLAKHLILLGPLSGKEKWKEFSRADIFCLPTYATEAMPVSILEAMMCSLPVVTTAWRAIPDMITDGKEGFLVKIRDGEMLATALSKLIENRAMRVEMGKAGREKFLSSFTIDKHLSGMEAAFKKAAGI